MAGTESRRYERRGQSMRGGEAVWVSAAIRFLVYFGGNGGLRRTLRSTI